MSATTTGAVAQSKNDIPWNKHVRQKKTPGDLAVDFVIVLLLVFTVVAVLYPLWFVVIASFSDPNAVAGGEVTLLPKGVTFVGYAKVFANHRIWQGYLNTIIYSVVGTAVNMAVTIPCAFALSRREFKPRRVIMFLFTVTMFISGGLIPNYLLYKALGINNTMWVFILPGAVSVYNVIVARSFFETSIPEELHDAAQIDGLSYFGYFFKIVLPLSSAILAVIGLYYFVGHWNDFMTGLIYISGRHKAAVAGGLAAVAAGGARHRYERQRHGPTAGGRPDQVRHHHRLHPASAGAVPVPAEVLQQGRNAGRRQGLIERDSPCSLVFPWPMNGSAVCCSRSSW